MPINEYRQASPKALKSKQISFKSLLEGMNGIFKGSDFALLRDGQYIYVTGVGYWFGMEDVRARLAQELPTYVSGFSRKRPAFLPLRTTARHLDYEITKRGYPVCRNPEMFSLKKHISMQINAVPII